MKVRRRFAWLGGAAAALLILGWLAARAYAPHWHPSNRAYPDQGIDVSHYQGRIDWDALPAQGVAFAYIKASEGGDLRDDSFAVNWAGAQQARIAHGAYHFFTLCRAGAEQAANFIGAVPADADMLPPAIDLEDMGPCPRPLTPAALRAQLAAFIAPVEARYGQPVRLYLTEEFDRAYGISDHFDRALWLRSIFWKPAFGARPWTLWQASDFRRLEGITGAVDWDVARP